MQRNDDALQQLVQVDPALKPWKDEGHVKYIPGHKPYPSFPPGMGFSLVVDVKFKHGRIERFRIDDPMLAAECAIFAGPCHIWVQCLDGDGIPSGRDVGLIVLQVLSISAI